MNEVALQTVTPTPELLEAQSEEVTPQPGTQAYNDMVFDHYISFVACGGTQVLEDGVNGVTSKKSMADFCQEWNVNRMALWRRRQADKDFSGKVSARRHKIFPIERVSGVWNGVILRAMAGNPEAAKLVLANFDDKFIMPTQKVEHEAGNSLSTLLNQARQRRIEAERVVVEATIEGEVVNEGN